jgi:hypothetical protein
VGARHVTVAIADRERGEHRREVADATREDGGDTGPDRALPDFTLALTGDEGGEPNGDTGDVGDGVEWTGSAVEGDAEVAGARLLRIGLRCQHQDRTEKQDDAAHSTSDPLDRLDGFDELRE